MKEYCEGLSSGSFSQDEVIFALDDLQYICEEIDRANGKSFIVLASVVVNSVLM